MLLDECEKGKVDLKLSKKIKTITHSDDVFTVETDSGKYHGKALVIATGGPSIPKMGATGFAYDLAHSSHTKVYQDRQSCKFHPIGNMVKQSQ